MIDSRWAKLAAWASKPLCAALAAGCCTIGFASGAQAEPPIEPKVVAGIEHLGQQGGELTTLIRRTKDVRLLYVYGYARLVGYTQDLSLEPDILKEIEIEDGRIFTFHLREGHKWSDGHPFTAEDFRFFWEDVANDPKLRPSGPPVQMLVDGQPPTVEVLDELTIRYSWSQANPYFVPALAAASTMFIYRPAHYLKQFHEAYVDAAALDKLVADDNARDWAQLFGRRDTINKWTNPDLPTLQPWMQTTAMPTERFIAVRNPYFHRVDEAGTQLPYLDRVILEVVDKKLIPIKTGGGETDLQARGLFFKDVTFLKENEEQSGLETKLWRIARGAHLALYPNLNANDAVWRDLFRDLRFRKALSYGIDRDEISNYLFFGLATPANNTVLEDSPVYDPSLANACLDGGLDEANALLDEIGLTERNDDGLRLLPDGRPAQFIVETAGEDTEQVDVLELISFKWRQLGIEIQTRPSEREALRNRMFSGEALMTIWGGHDNGVPTANMPPEDFAPTKQIHAQWPKWGQYFETKGQAGEAPDMAEAEQLMTLFGAWQNANGADEQAEIWSKMLQLYASQCYTLGTVGNVLQPVSVRQGLMNVPNDVVFNWEPHGQLGIYRPDTFWWNN